MQPYDSALSDPFDPGVREETEPPSSRDDNDAIIRRERLTLSQLTEAVEITIDGQSPPRTVYRATRATDFLGNERRESDGQPILRDTTIYDVAALIWPKEELNRRIPVLCHREHLEPVGLCRMCSVHIRTKGRDGRKLVPACQHRVENGMQVITRGYQGGERNDSRAADRVRQAVNVLTQLLVADHCHEDSLGLKERYDNELEKVAAGLPTPLRNLPGTSRGRNQALHPRSRRLELNTIQPPDVDTQTLPYLSRSILVDHDNCILCDRCVRSCAQVKKFEIIGHTGKGHRTRISFDLDQTMNHSNCTQCGECATACPTGALVFRRRVAPTAWSGIEEWQKVFDPDTGTSHSVVNKDFNVPLPADLLDARTVQNLTLLPEGGQPYQPFREIPYAYLKWNEGAVRQRTVTKNEPLARQGEYASTAFLVEKGNYQIIDDPPLPSSRLLALFSRWRSERRGKFVALRSSNDLILGEMACLTGRARGRSIRADSDGVVYEVARNLVDMMLRTRTMREKLDQVYRERATEDCLSNSQIFKELGDEQMALLRKCFVANSQIHHCEPGTRIVTEGEPAMDFYVIRLGFAQVTRSAEGRELHMDLLGEGQHFGEIALLWDYWANRPRGEQYKNQFSRRRRTSSVTALDHVELLRVNGQAFVDFLARPESSGILDAIAESCIDLLEKNKERDRLRLSEDLETEYVRQGLFQGKKLLVLDLERCTRCDECTRACADSHGDGHSRLLREGLRFDRFLVATCCRSCYKPYCLDGCPVDAIHRKGSNLEVVIDDHCIGCGLCERNCPYGAIQMVQVKPGAIRQRAVNCDLCQGDSKLVPVGSDPFCVRACPHDAAFRMSGQELIQELRRRSS
jgi:Fe-S-cluster-containing hydrogenase component 2/CRP-like cAMP-binding protein